MLFDELKAYAEGSIYPFHMPGHKRNSLLLGNDLPYNTDITEIDGFDNLHNPCTVIDDVQKLAAKAYCCKNSFLLVNGATCGILAAVRAMTDFGDKVIVARNCHKSVYNAIELCGLRPVYIFPRIDEEFGISSSITPEQITDALNKNTDARLIIITSPTYEGVVSDIKSISDIAHSCNVPLLVDEAHGAHFAFSEKFPREAVSCGADAAVVSLHKTLPSLTQTALLLTADDKYKEKISENLSVFETSSPSYVLMSSIEQSINFCAKSKPLFEKYIDKLSELSEFCKNFNNIKVLCCGNDNIAEHNFFDFDISKIVVSFKGLNISGCEFAELMRKKFNIEAEMAYSDYAIFMTSVCDTDIGFELLKRALRETDGMLSKENILPLQAEISPTLSQSFIPFEKYKYSGELTDFLKSDKKISLEYVWAYPPGVPLIVPGEGINDVIIERIILLRKSGVNIMSTKNEMPAKIYTVKLD